MKKITLSLMICITILKSFAQIPDPCTGSGASQAISTLSPCNCSEVNMVGGTPCNKSMFTTKALADASIHSFLTTQSTYVQPTIPVAWQDVRPQALSLSGAFKHEFCTEITTGTTTNRLNIINIAQVQINCNAVCQDYKIIQKTGSCGSNALTPTLVASALDPTVKYRQYVVAANTTYIICRQLYYDGNDLDCYGSWVGGDGLNSLGAQITSQHWFYFEETATVPLHIISFNGTIVDNKNKLQWTLENNTNISKFEIEKSLDGIHFNYIDIILPDFNSNIKQYHFIDNSPISVVGTSFYRLKIKETDNSFSYSDIIKIDGNLKSHFINITPNPAKLFTQLNIFISNPTNATVQIINTNGEIVQSQKSSLIKGINNIRLNISNISKGIYIVKLLNTTECYNQKLIIQ